MASVAIRNPETGKTKTTSTSAVDRYLASGWELADAPPPPPPPPVAEDDDEGEDE